MAWVAWAMWAAAGAGACLGALRAPTVLTVAPSGPPSPVPPRRQDLRGRRVVVGMVETFLAVPDDASAPWQRFRRRDGWVLDAFQQLTGCIPVVVPPTGCTFSNDTCELLPDLVEGNINLTFVTTFVDPTDLPIEYAPVFHFGRMSVVVPRAARIAVPKALAASVGVVVWLTLAVAVASGAGVWWAANRQSRKTLIGRGVHALVQVAGFVAAVPRSNASSLSGAAIRLLVGACSAFSIVFGCVFQGVLVENMTSAPFGLQINSLEELDASGMKIITPDKDYARGFRGSDSDLLNRLDSKQTVVPMKNDEILQLFTRISRQKDVAILMSQIAVLIFGGAAEDGKDSFHELHEYPSMYFMTYPIKRGSPYSEIFFDCTRRLIQAGLMTHWYKESVAEVIAHEVKSLLRETGTRTVRLEDLVPVLCALMVSHGLAALICVGEVLMLRHRRRIKNSQMESVFRGWTHPRRQATEYWLW